MLLKVGGKTLNRIVRAKTHLADGEASDQRVAASIFKAHVQARMARLCEICPLSIRIDTRLDRDAHRIRAEEQARERDILTTTQREKQLGRLARRQRPPDNCQY